MEKKERFGSAIAWCALLYFLILGAERLQSLLRILLNGGFFRTAFDIYVNLLTALSLLATLLLLIAFRKGILHPLFSKVSTLDYTRLTVAVGVLLLSGMVHTEYTIAPLQFGAYGALILAMILRTGDAASEEKEKVKLWYSLIYLIAFSMAIPVMYRSEIDRAALFHILEGVTAAFLVLLFSLMTHLVFQKQARDLLSPAPAMILLVLDGAILLMRWQEKINTFVLIFLSLTLFLFIVGKILFPILDKKKN